MTLGLRAVFAIFAAALCGCAGSEPQPRIDAVEPTQAYTDSHIRLTLTGAGFVPSFRLDPVSGERVATMEGFSGRVSSESGSAPLTNFGWIGPTQISASLDIQDPDDLGAGPCDVEITDPRGYQAVLPAGFLPLGPHIPPVVTVTSPDPNDLYDPGSIIHGEVTATDQAPGRMTALEWTYTEPLSVYGTQRPPVTGTCPFRPGPSQIDCTFDVQISASLAPGVRVNLEIVASDDAVPPKQTRNPIAIWLGAHPTVVSVRPQAGGMAGGTNVVIQGSGFVAGSRAYFGTSLLIPDGGIVVDRQTITGYTPAHAAGLVPVTVRSRLAPASWNDRFQYQFSPKIEFIEPSSGTPGQEVQITGTHFTKTTLIYLGQTLAGAKNLRDQVWVSANRIKGVVPSGTGRATVWAFDTDNGWDILPDGFTWIAP